MLVLLGGCTLDPYTPPSGKRTDTAEFTCRVNWHCLDVTTRNDNEVLCLVGEENDTPADFAEQNPQIAADLHAMCAATLPWCDYPQCSITCHFPKHRGCEP